MTNAAELFTTLRTRCQSRGLAGVAREVPQHDELGRRSININQNQGGSVYPFAEPCILGGLVSDISAVLPRAISGDVSVAITRDRGIAPIQNWHCRSVHDYAAFTNAQLDSLRQDVLAQPRLVFSDASSVILDTAGFSCHQVADRVWFFVCPRDTAIVKYAEYNTANDLDQPLLYPVDMPQPARLVSRCWSVTTPQIRYAATANSGRQFTLRMDEGLVAAVEGNTVTIGEKGLSEEEQRADVVLRTINNVEGDLNSNFDIQGDKGCINVTATSDEVTVALTTVPDGALEIHNDCAECCSCELYAHYFEELKRLTLLHNYEVQYAEYLNKYYELLLDYYHHTVNVRLNDLVKLKCMPGLAMSTFGFSVANPSGESIYGVEVTLEIESSKEGGKIKKIMVYDAIIDKAEYPTFIFTVPELKAHSVWEGAVSVCWNECGGEARVTLTTDLPWCQNKKECVATMRCERQAIPDINVKPIEPPEEIILRLPRPPQRTVF